MSDLDGEIKQVECPTFRLNVEFDGIAAILVVRLFVADGKIEAVRSLRLLNADGQPYRRVDFGKYESHIEMVADRKEQEPDV